MTSDQSPNQSANQTPEQGSQTSPQSTSDPTIQKSTSLPPKSQTLKLPLPLANTLPYLTGVLPYFGWILGLVILILEHDPKVRFHAIQAVVFFGASELLRFILSQTVIFASFVDLVYLGQFIIWLMLVYTAYQGNGLRLPVIATWIDKQFGK